MTHERPDPEDLIEWSGVLGDRKRLRNLQQEAHAHTLLGKWLDIAGEFTGATPLYIASMNAVEQGENFAECLSLLADWARWWHSKFGSIAQDTDNFIDRWTH